MVRFSAETEAAACEAQPSSAEDAMLDNLDDWGPRRGLDGLGGNGFNRQDCPAP
jgi:hypothetical protein